MKLIDTIVSAGGHPYYVGGYVRDVLMNRTPKDIDIEVYDISVEDLIEALQTVGKVDTVGRSFGIIKISVDGTDYDIALPRRESKAGTGHKGFIVEADPSMSIYEAAARRDFTCNSVMMDATTHEIIDLFNGEADINECVLRRTSVHFSEDPLRVLRGMQFASRFGWHVEKSTAEECMRLMDEYNTLAVERIWVEWEKWSIGGSPSYGLTFLMDTNWIELHQALYNLSGVPQDPIWHPEGDAWEHTKQVVDFAAYIAERDNLNREDRSVLVFAALLHDVGKPHCTVHCDDGRIRSYEHDEVGEPIARQFMESIGAPKEVTDRVCILVRNHMFNGEVTRRTVQRLAHRVYPETVEMLARVMEADASGRYPAPPASPGAKFVEMAKTLDCSEGKPKPILMGRHLLDKMKPGPEMGKVLNHVYQKQLDGEITTFEEAMYEYEAYCRDSSGK